MTLPHFDIPIYDLPIDNNELYEFDFSKDAQLLVIYTEDSTADALSKLEDILNATKIPNDKIARLKMKKISIALSPVLRKNYISNVISFGVHPYNLGLKIPNTKYHAHNFEGLLFLYADSLEKIKEDNSLKRKLWESIKNHLIKRTTI